MRGVLIIMSILTMSCSLEGVTEPNNCRCGNVEGSDVSDGVYTIESRNDCTSEVKTFIVTKEKYTDLF